MMSAFQGNLPVTPGRLEFSTDFSVPPSDRPISVSSRLVSHFTVAGSFINLWAQLPGELSR